VCTRRLNEEDADADASATVSTRRYPAVRGALCTARGYLRRVRGRGSGGLSGDLSFLEMCGQRGWGGFVKVREVSILIRYRLIETRQALCDRPSLAGSYGSTMAGGCERRGRGVGVQRRIWTVNHIVVISSWHIQSIRLRMSSDEDDASFYACTVWLLSSQSEDTGL
jgi:hypothetical protein